MVPVLEEPAPLEAIAPGEPDNAIDLENPPDFSVLQQVYPPHPPGTRAILLAKPHWLMKFKLSR